MAHARLQADGGHRPLSRAETLYGQAVTGFTLRVFLDDHPVAGRVIAGLAESFLAELVVPGAAPSELRTRLPTLDAKLNDGPFSDRGWREASTKVLAGEYGVLQITVHGRDRASTHAWLSVIVTPARAGDAPVNGRVEVYTTVPYLRALAAEPARVDALLRLGMAAWSSVPGGAAYGYASPAFVPSRPAFGQPGWRPPGPDVLTSLAPPAQRAHAIPVAYTGAVDDNLESLFRGRRGIKGAYWANFLCASLVGRLGGEASLRAALGDARAEPLSDGGLLIVATPSPLPEDSAATRERFLTLARVLEPAFLSRAETPESKRALLGYFARS